MEVGKTIRKCGRISTPEYFCPKMLFNPEKLSGLPEKFNPNIFEPTKLLTLYVPTVFGPPNIFVAKDVCTFFRDSFMYLLNFPGPLNFFMSLQLTQLMQLPQLSVLQLSHLPHFFLDLTLVADCLDSSTLVRFSTMLFNLWVGFFTFTGEFVFL